MAIVVRRGDIAILRKYHILWVYTW